MGDRGADSAAQWCSLRATRLCVERPVNCSRARALVVSEQNPAYVATSGTPREEAQATTSTDMAAARAAEHTRTFGSFRSSSGSTATRPHLGNVRRDPRARRCACQSCRRSEPLRLRALSGSRSTSGNVHEHGDLSGRHSRAVGAASATRGGGREQNSSSRGPSLRRAERGCGHPPPRHECLCRYRGRCAPHHHVHEIRLPRDVHSRRLRVIPAHVSEPVMTYLATRGMVHGLSPTPAG